LLGRGHIQIKILSYTNYSSSLSISLILSPYSIVMLYIVFYGVKWIFRIGYSLCFYQSNVYNLIGI